MSEDRGQCIDCGTALCHLDDDPNGDRNATCAQCRAQDGHDFDAEPNASFSRTGERADNKPQRRAMTKNLRQLFQSIPQQPRRQDATKDQLADLHAFANRLGLSGAADALKGMLGQ